VLSADAFKLFQPLRTKRMISNTNSEVVFLFFLMERVPMMSATISHPLLTFDLT
jgi:hypothetical protein